MFRATEAEEQAALVSWAQRVRVAEGVLGDFLLMNANETLFSALDSPAARAAYAAGLRRRGFRKGVFDLFLMIPRGRFHGLWIEMKRDRRAFRSQRAAEEAVSQEQHDFMRLARSVNYATAVAYGWAAAQAHIEDYLENAELCST